MNALVVETLSDLDTSRRIDVASDERHDVVGSTVTGLDDQAEVGRKSTRVPGPGGLFVGVRPREVVGKLAGSLEVGALVVRSILIFDLLGHRCNRRCGQRCRGAESKALTLHLVNGVTDTNEVSPSDPVQRVTSRADLPVDLVAATDPAEIG